MTPPDFALFEALQSALARPILLVTIAPEMDAGGAFARRARGRRRRRGRPQRRHLGAGRRGCGRRGGPVHPSGQRRRAPAAQIRQPDRRAAGRGPALGRLHRRRDPSVAGRPQGHAARQGNATFDPRDRRRVGRRVAARALPVRGHDGGAGGGRVRAAAERDLSGRLRPQPRRRRAQRRRGGGSPRRPTRSRWRRPTRAP